MSEKLKTLKDLKFDAEDIFVKKADLRKEAIKRVKIAREEAKADVNNEQLYFGVISGFKDFFNITNEEIDNQQDLGCGKELGPIEVRGIDEKPDVDVVHCGEIYKYTFSGENKLFLCDECEEKRNKIKGRKKYNLWVTPKEEYLLLNYKLKPSVYGWRFKMELDKINERGDIVKENE